MLDCVAQSGRLPVYNRTKLTWIHRTAKYDARIDARKQAALLSMGEASGVRMPSKNASEWRGYASCYLPSAGRCGAADRPHRLMRLRRRPRARPSYDARSTVEITTWSVCSSLEK